MSTLLLVPLDDIVVFPNMNVTVDVEVGDEERVLLVPRHEGEYAPVGTVAEVGERVRLPGGGRAVNLIGHDNILKILDLNAALAPYAHPGAWNDPNAMLIGTGALTPTEERAQLSLWSMLAAPLIAGGDLSTASRATLSVLTNREVIAVDQDPAGKQGTRVVHGANYQVWLRTLSDGSHALLLLNSGSRAATLRTDIPSLGLPFRSSYLVHELWRHRSYQTTGRVSARVQPHDVLMVKVNA